MNKETYIALAKLWNWEIVMSWKYEFQTEACVCSLLRVAAHDGNTIYATHSACFLLDLECLSRPSNAWKVLPRQIFDSKSQLAESLTWFDQVHFLMIWNFFLRESLDAVFAHIQLQSFSSINSHKTWYWVETLVILCAYCLSAEFIDE